MIAYEPGTWSIAFAFSLRGSVFPKAFAWAGPCSVTSIFLHWFVRKYEDFTRELHMVGDIAASVLGGFTFILGFLIVFRSQQAYSRWWDGGTLLQQLRGEWFNSYSCLLAFCTNDEQKQAAVHKFQHQLVRLYSLLYGCALQQVSTQEEVKFEIIAVDGLEEFSLDFLQSVPDRCEVVLQWIQRLIVESSSADILKIAPPILSRVFNELGNGIVNLNNVRKITNFPIPFPLAQMITVMLLFHIAITPIICAATVQSPFWCGLISFIVTFSYWTINYIAVELEMPFGDDANDLPLRAMQADMNSSLRTLISQAAQKVPVFDLKPDHELMVTRIVDFTESLTEEAELKTRWSAFYKNIAPGRRATELVAEFKRTKGPIAGGAASPPAGGGPSSTDGDSWDSPALPEGQPVQLDVLREIGNSKAEVLSAARISLETDIAVPPWEDKQQNSAVPGMAKAVGPLKNFEVLSYPDLTAEPLIPATLAAENSLVVPEPAVVSRAIGPSVDSAECTDTCNDDGSVSGDCLEDGGGGRPCCLLPSPVLLLRVPGAARRHTDGRATGAAFVS